MAFPRAQDLPRTPILVRGGRLVTMDSKRPLVMDGVVWIAEGQVAAITRRGDFAFGHRTDDVERCTLLAAGLGVARADLQDAGRVERERHLDRGLAARARRKIGEQEIADHDVVV